MLSNLTSGAALLDGLETWTAAIRDVAAVSKEVSISDAAINRILQSITVESARFSDLRITAREGGLTITGQVRVAGTRVNVARDWSVTAFQCDGADQHLHLQSASQCRVSGDTLYSRGLATLACIGFRGRLGGNWLLRGIQQIDGVSMHDDLVKIDLARIGVLERMPRWISSWGEQHAPMLFRGKWLGTLGASLIKRVTVTDLQIQAGEIRARLSIGTRHA